MFQRKLMRKQIESSGVRLGDSCSIFPIQGRRKAFTLNRHCIDLISQKYRPENLCMSYIELPQTEIGSFHYRLELDQEEERFVLKTIKGNAFWLNGSATKEAYVERLDRLYIDDNRINFDPFNLEEMTNRDQQHPVLMEQALLASNLKIFIEGETGTGKTYLASMIHAKSGRAGKFVAVNLSSYNPSLIESELFGHKKGSFTGAVSEKRGAFEEAAHGTLFLDEIDSLPVDLQTKLLTFLDNNRYRKVGDTNESMIATRLIFASGRSLSLLVDQGFMRRDFYYRLKSGHSIELRPLRNDVKRIKELCQIYGLKNQITFSNRILDFYETLAWPGNIRQLLGHLEKKRILTKSSKLDFDHLDEELLLQSSDLMTIRSDSDFLSMKDYKENYVKKVIAYCDGNVAMAARKLRVTEKTVKSILLKSS